jgi:hypothetical protein
MSIKFPHLRDIPLNLSRCKCYGTGHSQYFVLTPIQNGSLVPRLIPYITDECLLSESCNATTSCLFLPRGSLRMSVRAIRKHHDGRSNGHGSHSSAIAARLAAMRTFCLEDCFTVVFLLLPLFLRCLTGRRYHGSAL